MMVRPNNLSDNKGIKLILVDDNVPFRNALKLLLSAQFNCEIIAEASNGKEFLALDCHEAADVVIMDLIMPEIDGLKAAEEINWNFPFLKIIAVTMHCEKTYLKELIEKGFKGCVFKDNLYDKIYEAIAAVKNGQLYFPDELPIM